MEKSTVEILDIFENWVGEHQQLQEFLYDYDITTTENHNYPLFLINNSNNKISEHKTIVSFEVSILTLLKNELTNEKYGISDTLLIFNDFISHFYQGQSIYGFKILNENIETDTIYDKDDDRLIGLQGIIEVEVFNSLCDLVTPIKNYSFSCDFTQPGETIPYPYETDINFNFENETKPNVYYTPKSYIDVDTIVNISNNGTDGVYTFNGGNDFIAENLIDGGTYSYPRLRINTQESLDGFSYYRLKFNYKKISGSIPDMRFRIGETIATEYIVIDLPDEEGSIDVIYLGEGVPSDANKVNFLFFDTGTPTKFKMEINDYSLDLIEKNQTIDYREIGIGNTNYTVTAVNTTTSHLTVTENGTELILDNNITGVNNALYPGIRIYKEYDIDFETNKTYRLKFRYKLNSGTLPDSMYFRIGEYPNNYSGMYYFDVSGEGEIDITWFQNGTTNFNYLHFYFGNNTPIFNMSYYDLEFYKLDVDEIGIDKYTVNGFGNHKFITTDTSEQEDYCISQIEVPTPSPGLKLLIPDKKVKGDRSAIFRVYYKPGDLSINWGDGTLEHFTKTNTSYYNYYHDYDEPGEYDIHIYDTSMDGLFSLSYSIYVVDITHFFKKFDSDFDMKYFYTYYNSTTFGDIEAIQNPITNIYFYLYPALYGDFGKSSIIKAKYFRLYLLKPYNNYDYSTYGIGLYGDVGTVLKGYSEGGVYTKSYCDLYRSGQIYYQDRIDGPLQIINRLIVRGYYSNIAYYVMNNADEICQLIIDIDTWRTNTIPSVDLLYNVDVSTSPLYADFLIAKNNMIADGTVWLQ